MNGNYQKALKKLILYFLLNPVPFNEQDHEKQKWLATCFSCYLGLPNKSSKKSFISESKKKNTFVSVNVGGGKNLHPGGRKFVFFNQFNGIFL